MDHSARNPLMPGSAGAPLSLLWKDLAKFRNPCHQGKSRMQRVFAAAGVAATAAAVSLGASSPAQAYPDTPPSSQATPPKVQSTTPTTDPAVTSDLPDSSGGANDLIIGGGVALVLAGGAVVLVARRRQHA
jgi:hypothetical protein